MAYRTDLFFDNKFNQVFGPENITTDADSTSIDMQGFGELVALVNLGGTVDILDPTDSIGLALQQSDDNITFTDVPPDELTVFVSSNPAVNLGQFAFLDDNAQVDAVYFTGYKGYSRYLRIQIRMNGTHAGGIPVSAMLIQGFPDGAAVNAGS